MNLDEIRTTLGEDLANELQTLIDYSEKYQKSYTIHVEGIDSDTKPFWKVFYSEWYLTNIFVVSKNSKQIMMQSLVSRNECQTALELMNKHE